MQRRVHVLQKTVWSAAPTDGRRLASKASAHFREASSFSLRSLVKNRSRLGQVAARVSLLGWRSGRAPWPARRARRRGRASCGTSSSSSVSGDGGIAGRGGDASFAATPSSAPARLVAPRRARSTAVAARCARAAGRTRRRPRSRARAARRAPGRDGSRVSPFRHGCGARPACWHCGARPPFGTAVSLGGVPAPLRRSRGGAGGGATGSRCWRSRASRRRRSLLRLAARPYGCGLLCDPRACSFFAYSSPAQLCGLRRSRFNRYALLLSVYSPRSSKCLTIFRS